MSPQQIWHVIQDETEWDSDVPLESLLPDDDKSQTATNRDGRGLGISGGLALLLLLSGAILLWQQAQIGLLQTETELTDALTVEELARQQGDSGLAQTLLDTTTDESWQARLRLEIQTEIAGTDAASDKPTQMEIIRMDLRESQALVQLQVTDPKKPFPYRETRFYRQTTLGWLRTQPVPAFWGSAQTLESTYFVFQFHHRDLPAVREAAPRLDALYVQIHTLLGLPLAVASPDQRIPVELVLDDRRRVRFDPFVDEISLQVNAPVLSPAPLHLSEADVLVEAVALPLRHWLANQSVSNATNIYQPAPELLAGLSKWLAWETGNWQATGREQRVRWLYVDLPDGRLNLPTDSAEFSQMAWTWRLAVDEIPFPYYYAGQTWLLFNMQPATRLHHLPRTLVEGIGPNSDTSDLTSEARENRQGLDFAFATLLEYAKHEYGLEAVPSLLQSIVNDGSWQEATTNAFGITASAFEEGWRQYLAMEYGVVWE